MENRLGGLKTREIRTFWLCEAIFPLGNNAFSMSYPGRHLRPAQVRPKSEAFLLKDLADKSLRGPQNPRNTYVLALRSDFHRGNKAFSMAYPGRQLRPAQVRPKSGSKVAKSGPRPAKRRTRSSQERPKSSQKRSKSSQERPFASAN